MKKRTIALLVITPILVAGSFIGYQMASERLSKIPQVQKFQQLKEEHEKKVMQAAEEKKIAEFSKLALPYKWQEGLFNEYNNALNNTYQWNQNTFNKLLDEYKNENYGQITQSPKSINVHFNSAKMEKQLEKLNELSQSNLDIRFKDFSIAVDRMLSKSNTFLTNLKELEKYSKSKSYKKDKGEFLKSQNDILISSANEYIEATTNALDAYYTALDELNAWNQDIMSHLDDDRLDALLKLNNSLRKFNQSFIYAGVHDQPVEQVAAQNHHTELLNTIQTDFDKYAKQCEKTGDNDSSNYEKLKSEVAELIQLYKACHENNYTKSDVEVATKSYNDYLVSTNRVLKFVGHIKRTLPPPSLEDKPKPRNNSNPDTESTDIAQKGTKNTDKDNPDNSDKQGDSYNSENSYTSETTYTQDSTFFPNDPSNPTRKSNDRSKPTRRPSNPKEIVDPLDVLENPVELIENVKEQLAKPNPAEEILNMQQ